MATVPITGRNAYIGFAKQSSQGVGAAPTIFPRWLDGTSIEFDLKTETIEEGDGSRRSSIVIKNMQSAKIKLVVTPRANELGFLETAAMGSGSDVMTPPSISTTLSSQANVGDQQVLLASNTGLTSNGTAYIVLDPGSSTEEIIPVTTPGSGSGPYTYAIPATYNYGRGLVYQHNAGVTTKGAAVHVITDTYDGNYYSCELGLGALQGGAGIVLRVRDCKVDACKISSAAGEVLKYEIELVGLVTISTTPATITVENHPVLLFYQGVWTVDGATTGSALAVETFTIDRKNNTDLVQTEQVTGAAVIFGKLEGTFDCEVVYESGTIIKQVHFGGPSGTTDNQQVWLGSLGLLFVGSDKLNTVNYEIPTLAYTKAAPPAPKSDGKHFTQAMSATATSNQGTNAFLMKTTVTNTQYSQY
jgi:hypothetical protein